MLSDGTPGQTGNFKYSTAVSGSISTMPDGELNIAGWLSGATAGKGAIANWLYFDITTDAFTSIVIETINFSGWRNGSGAPDMISFDYSVNGGTSWLQFGTASQRTGVAYASNASASFTDSLTIAEGQTVRIRFAPYRQSEGTSTGNWHINGLSVDGTINVIPEPSTYAIGGGLLLLGLGILHRRRRAR